MKLLIITTIPTSIFISLISLTSLISGEVATEWTEYNNLNLCRVTFSYPSNWILSEAISRNRFDTSDSSLVSARSPNEVQNFAVGDCHLWEPKEKVESSNHTLLFLLYVIDGLRGVNTRSDVMTIESPHLVPDIINNSSKNAVVYTLKKNDRGVEIGIEFYFVLHKGIVYMFRYYDLANDFDSPESKQIRDRILQSIKFLN